MAEVKIIFQKDSVLLNDVIQIESTDRSFNFKRSGAIIKIYKDDTRVKETDLKKLVDPKKDYQNIVEIDYPFNRITCIENITVVVENISEDDKNYLQVKLQRINLNKKR